MNITIVTPRYPPPIVGGGEVSVKLLATTLAKRETIDNVQVLSFDGEGKDETEDVPIKRLGDIQSPLREMSNIRTVNKIRENMYQEGVIHSYNMDLHPAVGGISAIDGVPTVATLNSYDFFKQTDVNVKPSIKRQMYEIIGLPTTGKVMTRCMKEIDRYIPLSESVKNIYLNNGFEERKMRVIPNMLDESFIDENVEFSDNGGVILYVGGLRPGKGVKYLIDSIAHLPDRYSLKIVGDGKIRDELKKRTRESNLNDRIDFTGNIPYDRLSNIYTESDIFVHPGIWPEPLNRTLFEAMQAQLPVVCTNIGGPPEMVPQEELHVEPGSPVDLATGIRYAYRNKDNIGRYNLQYLYDNYTPYEIIQKIIDVYRELI